MNYPSMLLSLALTGILLMSCCGLYSQNIEFNSQNFPDKKILRQITENLREGEYYYTETEYATALKYFEAVHRINSQNAKLNYSIGLCYLNLVPRSRAIEYFEKAHHLIPEERLYLLQLAKAYQLSHNFEKAIEVYQTSKNLIRPDDSETVVLEIDKRIRECRFAINKMKHPLQVRIENLGSEINTAYPEYGPIITADESVLIFTSRRPGTTGGERDPRNPGYYEDIYISYNNNGRFSKPYNPGKPLNTSTHNAILGLTNDGQRLLTYSPAQGGSIYESRLTGNEWSKPYALPSPINSKYYEPSASYSFDERTLYFVSDRPGGFGGTDIYVCRYSTTGGWGKPENLGSTINTPLDEDAVFIHPDGKTLYFSSKGHEGMGGYDIFSSILRNGVWSVPYNLGYPINTAEDDIFFSITADNRHAYFSSSREEGFGSQDIYRISFFSDSQSGDNTLKSQLTSENFQITTDSKKESLSDFLSGTMILLKGIIRDEVSLQPIGASIELVDNNSNEVIATLQSNIQSGKYLVALPAGRHYGIAVKAEGYLFHSFNFNIPDLSEFRVVEKDIIMKKVEKGKEVVLNNVFFDYNEYSLRKESIAELDRLWALLQEYPNLRIEISGHTDNIGSAEFNKDLSLNRAKAVADYLISKGIPSHRLSYIGYGFEKPLAPNETEEGRSLNRRSEFKVIDR